MDFLSSSGANIYIGVMNSWSVEFDVFERLQRFELFEAIFYATAMADKDHLIVTAIGPDQVGLVQRISEFISRHGCNIEDSKMAVFCGEFAVIVLITGDPKNLANFAREYHEIKKKPGLSLAEKTPSSRKTGDAF